MAGRRKGRKIINGELVGSSTYDMIYGEGMRAVKNMIFGTFSHIIMCAGSAFISKLSTTFIQGLEWFTIFFLVLLGLHMGYRYIRPRNGWRLSQMNPAAAVLIGVLFVWVVLHELRIEVLETRVDALTTHIKYVDNRLDNLTRRFDEEMFKPFVKLPWIHELDIFVSDKIYMVLNRLSKNHYSRRDFGLGCFVQGTKIQMDEYGNTINIEDIGVGDYVFNPVAKRRIKVDSYVGTENGILYNITTNEFKSVIVTETHPMIICVTNDNCKNIAAKDVKLDDLTKTVGGIEKIISIEMMEVENEMVYNLMFDVPSNVSILSRAIVANNVVTLDLFAQKEHH